MILCERGQLAVEAGHKANTERCWNEMLGTMIPVPAEQVEKKFETVGIHWRF